MVVSCLKLSKMWVFKNGDNGRRCLQFTTCRSFPTTNLTMPVKVIGVVNINDFDHKYFLKDI